MFPGVEEAEDIVEVLSVRDPRGCDLALVGRE